MNNSIKRTILTVILFLSIGIFYVSAAKKEKNPIDTTSEEIIKKGISLGPLPVVAFDQDKGFQYGALLNLYDYGDGTLYPSMRQHWYIEASAYTKGSQQYIITYDTKYLIPDVRLSVATNLLIEKSLDFYGFNGYQSYYDHTNLSYWKKNKPEHGCIKPEYMSTYYRMERIVPTFKADFIGKIWKNKFFWEVGYHLNWFRLRAIDSKKINEGKDSAEMFIGQTLFEKYKDWGIIPKGQADGGFSSALRLGLIYDTRNFEAAPTKGIWAEAHAIIAPKFLGTSHPYYRYSATFRHYIPLIRQKLTFAYRLNYQGTIGNSAPFYVLPYFTYVGPGYDRSGIGGYRTVRGLLKDRVQGLDVFFYNTELRWKVYSTQIWNQNIYFAFNLFFDGAITTRNYDISYRGANNPETYTDYSYYINNKKADGWHLSAGGGFRIAINQNFIIALDYGKPFDKQDGNGSLYINTGYLF